ncbi:hypothetical protein AB0K68_24730 [Streptomyces sp. NPDC050698]
MAENERLLATLVADGLGNKQIAVLLSASEKSVEGRLSPHPHRLPVEGRAGVGTRRWASASTAIPGRSALNHSCLVVAHRTAYATENRMPAVEKSPDGPGVSPEVIAVEWNEAGLLMRPVDGPARTGCPGRPRGVRR